MALTGLLYCAVVELLHDLVFVKIRPTRASNHDVSGFLFLEALANALSQDKHVSQN